MMADKFFKKHDLSIWVFVVGISVYISLLLGGGVSCMLMIELLEGLLGKFTHNEFAIVMVLSEVIMALWITVTNMHLLVVRGRPKFVIMNQMLIGLQLLIFLLALLFFDHEYKWFTLSFVIFPFFAYRLMASAKYQTFLVYYESIRQDPEGFRRHFFERLEK